MGVAGAVDVPCVGPSTHPQQRLLSGLALLCMRAHARLQHRTQASQVHDCLIQPGDTFSPEARVLPPRSAGPEAFPSSADASHNEGSSLGAGIVSRLSLNKFALCDRQQRSKRHGQGGSRRLVRPGNGRRLQRLEAGRLHSGCGGLHVCVVALGGAARRHGGGDASLLQWGLSAAAGRCHGCVSRHVQLWAQAHG